MTTTFPDIYDQLTRPERARLSAGLGGTDLDAVAKDHRSIAGWVLNTIADRLGHPTAELFPRRNRQTPQASRIHAIGPS